VVLDNTHIVVLRRWIDFNKQSIVPKIQISGFWLIELVAPLVKQGGIYDAEKTTQQQI